jgi:hypothetical protein
VVHREQKPRANRWNFADSTSGAIAGQHRDPPGGLQERWRSTNFVSRPTRQARMPMRVQPLANAVAGHQGQERIPCVSGALSSSPILARPAGRPRLSKDTMAETQSYKNHAQIVFLYHRALTLLLLLILIGSIVNLTKSWGDSTRFYSASLILALTIAAVLLFVFVRVFPLKAQDRAIRAEEQLRHYVLTGTLLDPRLTMRQIVALRFAADPEFVALAQRAADQSMTPDAIKRDVKQWRADTYRV